jgi:hypothetical protein
MPRGVEFTAGPLFEAILCGDVDVPPCKDGWERNDIPSSDAYIGVVMVAP